MQSRHCWWSACENMTKAVGQLLSVLPGTPQSKKGVAFNIYWILDSSSGVLRDDWQLSCTSSTGSAAELSDQHRARALRLHWAARWYVSWLECSQVCMQKIRCHLRMYKILPSAFETLKRVLALSIGALFTLWFWYWFASWCVPSMLGHWTLWLGL